MLKYIGLSKLAMIVCFSLATQILAAPIVTIATDHVDAIYKQGQAITFNVMATEGGKPLDGVVVPYAISKDGAATIFKGEIALGPKPVAIQTSLDEPGFVKLFVSVPGHLDYKKRKKPAVAGAAVDPHLIQPSMPVPDDFDAFWEAKKKIVLASPMEPVLTPFECARKNVLVYDLQLNCPDGQGNSGGQPVSGYFAMPENAQPGKHPAVLYPHSAGVKTAYLNNVVDRGAYVGMIALDFNAHGIPNGQTKDYYKKRSQGDLKDYRVRGHEDRETYYFLGMYMRLYRALQFLKARPEWDGKTLIVWGSSQGGGQTLVAGGLDPDISLLLCGVPAMCDHTAPRISRTAGWPRIIRKLKLKKETPQWDQTLKTMRYFDAVNFATRIKSPIQMTVGYCDVTCSPTSVMAAYNAIPGENKSLYHGLKMHHNQNKEVWNLFKNAAFTHAKKAMAKQ